MVKKRQDTGKPLVKSRLLKLKEWLTVPEAARYLSTVFDEEVTEADIIKCALDGHLNLSVLFVNSAHAIYYGRVLYFIEWEKVFRKDNSWEKVEFFILIDGTVWCRFEENDPVEMSGIEQIEKLKNGFNKEGEGFDFKDYFLKKCPQSVQKSILSDMAEKVVLSVKKESEKYGRRVIQHISSPETKIESLRGVWDLTMMGAERQKVKAEYHRLTNGPEVSKLAFDGAFVEREGEVWLIQKLVDDVTVESKRNHIKNLITEIKSKLYEIGERLSYNNNDQAQRESLITEKKWLGDCLINETNNYNSIEWHVAGNLPDDSIFVIKKSALRELEERLSTKDTESEKPSNTKKETTTMHIIGALFKIIEDHKLFKTKTELYEHIDTEYRYLRVQGLTTSNLSRWLPEGERCLNDAILAAAKDKKEPEGKEE